jgi:hypothetical protein
MTDAKPNDHDEHGAPKDVRDKFREALERKKGSGAHGAGATGPAHDKASGATANSKTKREFRRKSGG